MLKWNKTLSAMLLLGYVLLPFEIPVIAYAYLLNPYFGEYYRLLNPVVILAFLVFAVGRNRAPVERGYAGGVLLIILGVLASLLVLVNVPKVITHAVLLACAFYVAWHAWESKWQGMAIKGILYGAAAYALVGLVLYFEMLDSAIEIYPYLANESWDFVLIAMRAPGELVNEVPWFYWVGNINKASNIQVLALLLCGYALSKNWLTVRMYLVLSLPIVALLIVLYSRGAFATLAILAMLFALYQSRRAAIWRKDSILVLCTLMLPLLVSVSTPALVEYWFDLGTVEERMKALAMASGAFDLKHLIFGYGIGGYGLMTYGAGHASTHNILFDTWFDYGILGVFGLALLLFKGITKYRVGSLEAMYSFIGIIAILLLGLREYSLVYLDALVMGSFFLGLFVAMSGRDGKGGATGHATDSSKP